MTDYHKVSKDETVYTKVNRKEGKGWLSAPWFYEWFTDTKFEVLTIYNRIIREITDYKKVDKE